MRDYCAFWRLVLSIALLYLICEVLVDALRSVMNHRRHYLLHDRQTRHLDALNTLQSGRLLLLAPRWRHILRGRHGLQYIRRTPIDASTLLIPMPRGAHLAGLIELLFVLLRPHLRSILVSVSFLSL